MALAASRQETTMTADTPTTPARGVTIASMTAAEDAIGPSKVLAGDNQQRRALLGRASFVDDVNVPQQLWLAVVRSPIAHGKLRGIDSREALALPGVHAVLSAEDLPQVPRIPIRVLPQPQMEGRLQSVIAEGRVRYVGEPVAVVLADDPYLAEDAADLVMVDVDPLAVSMDASDADAPPLWDAATDNTLAKFRAVDGPAAREIISEAEHVVRGTFKTQRHTAVPIETRGLIAEWRGEELHLWGPTKFLTFTRKTVAGFFNISPTDVVCHRVDVGGMFGVRGEVYPEDFLVPWAARLLGRPVKWIEDRREHFLSINHSRDHQHDLELAVDKEGTFLALRVRGVLDLGAYPRPIGGRITQIAAESLAGPYRWQSLDIECRGVASNKTPAGTIRGPSSYEVTFVRERAIDMAAKLVGISALEIRRRNLIPPIEMPFTQQLGPEMHPVEYDHADYAAVLTTTLERSGYERLMREVADRRAAGELVGVGVGLFLDHSGLGSSETLRIGLESDGSFLLATSAAEVGQGLDRVAARVVAEHLGVPDADVRVWSGDSRAHHEGNGTFASRSTIFVGNAAVDGCEQLLEIARHNAAELLDADPAVLSRTAEGFETPDGSLASWKEVAPIEVIGRHDQSHATYGFTTQLAVVSIDPGTGDPRVERLITGYDVGRAIDPVSVEGQLVGAGVMGVGGALFEELSYDSEGQPLSTTFLDYLMPTSSLSPVVEAHIIEGNMTATNQLGIRGAGEAGIIGVGAAVANAVADALGPAGSHITSLPLRPEILRALARTDLADRPG
jgi:carbon-monoxide dehydrogenase large subunit